MKVKASGCVGDQAPSPVFGAGSSDGGTSQLSASAGFSPSFSPGSIDSTSMSSIPAPLSLIASEDGTRATSRTGYRILADELTALRLDAGRASICRGR